jgi:hypothetical protein
MAHSPSDEVSPPPSAFQVGRAIDESFKQFHSLMAAAGSAGQPADQREVPTGNMELICADCAADATAHSQPRSAASEGVVQIWVMHGDETERAVARSERRDDRVHLDINLHLGDLDAYEAEAFKRLASSFRSLLVAARQENRDERITQLMKAIAPPDPVTDVELSVAEATVSLRREFLEAVPVLTSAQVHTNAGFPSGNPSQTVLRWRKQGKIFSVNHGGRELYPAFQFGADGRPRPIVAELLVILKRDADRTDWDNALWFTGESGWLDGRTPLECLSSDPGLVTQAAEQELLRDEY